jgi:hypothetical protein
MTKADSQILRLLVNMELQRIELDYDISLTKLSSRIDKQLNVMGDTLQLHPGKAYEVPRYVYELMADQDLLEASADVLDRKTISQAQWVESSYDGLSLLSPFFYQMARSCLRKLKQNNAKDYTETEGRLIALVDSRLNKIVKFATSRKPMTFDRQRMQAEEILLHDFLRTIVENWREGVLNLEHR